MSILSLHDGEEPKIDTDPISYIWREEEGQVLRLSKQGTAQKQVWVRPGIEGDTPSSHLWHHVRHELLSPKTRLDGHHQNHVHERDKGNHLLHWCPWLDANTNLGKGGGGGKGEARRE